jgi:hypothetical protein
MMSTKRWRRPRSTGALGWARSVAVALCSPKLPRSKPRNKSWGRGGASQNPPSENRRQGTAGVLSPADIPSDHSCPCPQHISDTAPDTARCDSGHRPLAIEHRIIGSYNDLREPSSSTCFNRYRAAVGGGSCCRLRAPRSHAYSRRAGMLPSHGPALRAERNAREPFVLPSSGSP